MKRSLAAAALALFCLAISAAEITEWATAVSKQASTGRAIVFRYAKEFRQDFKRSDFPDRIIIDWKYNSDSGMPAVREREAMDRMEDSLRPLVEKSGQSVLALVSTGKNLREWIFYAKSGKAFIATLNKSFADQPQLLVEIHAELDPTWVAYEEFLAGVRE